MVGSEDPLQNSFKDYGQFEIKTFPIYAPP